MKVKFIIALLPAVLFYVSSCQDKNANLNLQSEYDSISYIIGYQMGANLTANSITSVNIDAFQKGMQDALGGENFFMDAIDANMMITQYLSALRVAESKTNLEEGIAFLEENKTREGVTTTESGLQYEIIEEGSGPKPTDTSTVTVHYEGTLIDGTVFDSSIERGEPARFKLNQVIPGWTEALQLMPEGSKWKLFVPTELAYGENPRQGGLIKPNMVLIFEVELISID